MKIITLVSSCLLLLNTVFAGDFYVLDLRDQHIRSSRGEKAKIFLKQQMRQQHRNVHLRNATILSAMLVAKTRVGRGNARLFVAGESSNSQIIAGTPRQFNNESEATFTRSVFTAPQLSDRHSQPRGAWQLHLRGNFIVRQVVIEITNNTRNSIKEFSLDLNNTHLRTRGEFKVIDLSDELDFQHYIDPRKYSLISVEVYAKSRLGRGKAYIEVNGEATQKVVLANPQGNFLSNDLNTYDIKKFLTRDLDSSSSLRNSQWYLMVKGNIKINHIKLIVKKKRVSSRF